MTRNKLSDLNNHLFAQLERLSEEDMTVEELKKEIDRSAAITKISEQILDTGNLVLKGQMAFEEHLQRDAKKSAMLEG